MSLRKLSSEARPQSLMQVRTVATSQVHLGVIEGGLLRKSALMNLTTRGCSPTDGDTLGCSMEQMADLWTPTVLHAKFLVVAKYKRYSNKVFTGTSVGTNPRPWHQLIQDLQTERYWTAVDLLQEEERYSATSSDTPVAMTEAIKAAKPSIGAC